jgi:hypothetical protein
MTSLESYLFHDTAASAEVAPQLNLSEGFILSYL